MGPYVSSPVYLLPLHSPHSSIFLTGTSVQFSSVTQSCPTLCDPMNRSTPGLLVHHQLPGVHSVHRVGDAIQPSHPLSSPSPPAPNPSQHWNLLSLKRIKFIFFMILLVCFLSLLGLCCSSSNKGFFLVAASGGFSLWWPLLLQSTGSRVQWL